MRGRGSVRYGNEVRSELDSFLIRLAALGASREQLDMARAHWDEFDSDWTPEKRAGVKYWPDSRLRREVLAVLQEYADDTGTELDAVAKVITLGSISEVLAWVGEDRERAMAAARAEHVGKSRGRLLTQLKPIIDAGD